VLLASGAWCSVAVWVVSHTHKGIYRWQRAVSVHIFLPEESGCPVWFFSPRVLPSQGIFCSPRSNFPSCEQRGTPARNPSLSSWISRHSAPPLVLVSAPLTPCRIFVSSRHFCQDLAASSLGQIPARLCVRRPDFCCRTLCVPG
jgi:hypothetical protein